jgi:hypothetical protein
MEFDRDKILTMVNAEKATVGMRGWLADTPPALRMRVESMTPEELITITPDVLYPFQSARSLSVLFYPAPEPTYAERQVAWVKETGIKEGDKVRVTRKVKEHEDDWDCSWTEEMDECVGRIGTVGIPTTGSTSTTGSVRVAFEDDFWYFPYYVLEPVKETYREYTDEELNNLVGKVITSHATGNNRVVGERLGPKLVRVGGDRYSAKDLLEWYTINGERCGVKE